MTPVRYPPSAEVASHWRALVPCGLDAEVSALLEQRGLRSEWVDDLHLAGALPRAASLPFWASFQGARVSAAASGREAARFGIHDRHAPSPPKAP